MKSSLALSLLKTPHFTFFFSRLKAELAENWATTCGPKTQPQAVQTIRADDDDDDKMMITAEMTLAPGYEDLGLMTGEGAELGHSNRGGRLYDQAGRWVMRANAVSWEAREFNSSRKTTADGSCGQLSGDELRFCLWCLLASQPHPLCHWCWSGWRESTAR